MTDEAQPYINSEIVDKKLKVTLIKKNDVTVKDKTYTVKISDESTPQKTLDILVTLTAKK